MQMSCSIIRTECRIIEFIIGIGCFQLKCIKSIIIDVKGRERVEVVVFLGKEISLNLVTYEFKENSLDRKSFHVALHSALRFNAV